MCDGRAKNRTDSDGSSNGTMTTPGPDDNVNDDKDRRTRALECQVAQQQAQMAMMMLMQQQQMQLSMCSPRTESDRYKGAFQRYVSRRAHPSPRHSASISGATGPSSHPTTPSSLASRSSMRSGFSNSSSSFGAWMPTSLPPMVPGLVMPSHPQPGVGWPTADQLMATAEPSPKAGGPRSADKVPGTAATMVNNGLASNSTSPSRMVVGLDGPWPAAAMAKQGTTRDHKSQPAAVGASHGGASQPASKSRTKKAPGPAGGRGSAAMASPRIHASQSKSMIQLGLDGVSTGAAKGTHRSAAKPDPPLATKSMMQLSPDVPSTGAAKGKHRSAAKPDPSLASKSMMQLGLDGVSTGAAKVKHRSAAKPDPPLATKSMMQLGPDVASTGAAKGKHRSAAKPDPPLATKSMMELGPEGTRGMLSFMQSPRKSGQSHVRTGGRQQAGGAGWNSSRASFLWPFVGARRPHGQASCSAGGSGGHGVQGLNMQAGTARVGGATRRTRGP